MKVALSKTPEDRFSHDMAHIYVDILQMESLKVKDIPSMKKNLKKNNEEIEKLREQITDVSDYSVY